ncbi:MAG TPA: RidA family protein [Burkholderiales bacterium]|nr:RidA family protein [Burkholderiales bacterium]
MTTQTDKQYLFPDGLSRPTGVWTTVTTARPGRLVFVSGLTAKNAAGVVVGVGDIRAQTRQVCENLTAAMRAAGGSLADIMSVTVFIRNMDDFAAIHDIRREYFGAAPPASTMVEISRFTHPDMLIEINAIGVLP